MNLVLNICWFILGGWVVLLFYLFGCVMLCLTIIGIPFGVANFKLAILAIAPFGKTIREKQPPGGVLTILLNVIWIIFAGFELALLHLALALLLAITFVGLPFAAQHLKLVRMALLPFGYRSGPNDI